MILDIRGANANANAIYQSARESRSNPNGAFRGGGGGWLLAPPPHTLSIKEANGNLSMLSYSSAIYLNPRPLSLCLGSGKNVPNLIYSKS